MSARYLCLKNQFVLFPRKSSVLWKKKLVELKTQSQVLFLETIVLEDTEKCFMLTSCFCSQNIHGFIFITSTRTFLSQAGWPTSVILVFGWWRKRIWSLIQSQHGLHETPSQKNQRNILSAVDFTSNSSGDSISKINTSLKPFTLLYYRHNSFYSLLLCVIRTSQHIHKAK